LKKIKVPKDIREYEDKLKLGVSLTYREWIAVGLTLIIPWYLNRQLILMRISELMRNTIVYSLVALFALYGFTNLYGMKFEKFLFYFIKYLIKPAKKVRKKEGDLLEI